MFIAFFFKLSRRNFFQHIRLTLKINFIFWKYIFQEWKYFFERVGGFSKILRNYQSGSWQMLTSAYKVGGWGEKRPKKCLRNIWMVPNSILLSQKWEAEFQAHWSDLMRPLTNIPSRPMGHICKYEDLFWTLCNSFFQKF